MVENPKHAVNIMESVTARTPTAAPTNASMSIVNMTVYPSHGEKKTDVQWRSPKNEPMLYFQLAYIFTPAVFTTGASITHQGARNPTTPPTKANSRIELHQHMAAALIVQTLRDNVPVAVTTGYLPAACLPDFYDYFLETWGALLTVNEEASNKLDIPPAHLKRVQEDTLHAMSETFAEVFKKRLTFRHQGGAIVPAKLQHAASTAVFTLNNYHSRKPAADNSRNVRPRVHNAGGGRGGGAYSGGRGGGGYGRANGGGYGRGGNQYPPHPPAGVGAPPP